MKMTSTTDNFNLDLYDTGDPANLNDQYNASMHTIDETMLTISGTANTALKLAQTNKTDIALKADSATTYSKTDIDNKLVRKFVVFGDSWTHLFDDYIPTTVPPMVGGTLVKNYGVPGAFIGSSGSGYTGTDDQVATAVNDTTVDRNMITDVLVVASVNNIGAPTKTIEQWRAAFEKFRIYPHARYWLAQNAKMALNTDNNALRSWYFPIQRGASLAGFAVAHYSPLWLLDENYLSYWDGMDWTQRHPNQTGVAAWTRRLAGFLSGEEYVPSCDIPVTLDSTLAGKLSMTALHINDHALMLDGFDIVQNIQLVGRETDTAKFADIGMVNAFTVPECFAPMNSTFWPALMRASTQSWDDFTYGLAGGIIVTGDGQAKMDATAFRKNQGYIFCIGKISIA